MLIRGSVAPAIDDLVRDAIVTDEAQPACRLPEPKIGVGKRRGRDRKISEPGTYNVEGFRVRSEPAQCRERGRSEEHTSELQSLMRISYAVFCLTKQKDNIHNTLIREVKK